MRVSASRVAGAILISVGLGGVATGSAHGQQASPGNTSATATAGTRLAEIKGLYEAAEYDRALVGIDEGVPAVLTDETRDIEIYEALCLLALGRNAQATERIEGVLRAEPLYQPSGELPRRLHLLVEATRTRLKPALAQAGYAAGWKLYEAAQYAAAIEAFNAVLQLTAEPSADASTLADVRILARGFRDLSERAIDAAKPKVVDSPPPPPLPPPPAPAVASAPVVVPPIVIRQALPLWPTGQSPTKPSQPATRDGVLEVVISASGTVSSATLIKRIDPLYDVLLLDAAKRWRYEPATMAGVPVEYVKRVEVNIR